MLVSRRVETYRIPINQTTRRSMESIRVFLFVSQLAQKYVGLDEKFLHLSNVLKQTLTFHFTGGFIGIRTMAY